jgi:hypothetical protein
VSNRYSPTTCSISRFSIGGYVYCDSTDGVRKQVTMWPLSGRGGYVPGTPSTIERLPPRVARSHSRGSLIAVPFAMYRLSYEWSERLRNP